MVARTPMPDKESRNPRRPGRIIARGNLRKETRALVKYLSPRSRQTLGTGGSNFSRLAIMRQLVGAAPEDRKPPRSYRQRHLAVTLEQELPSDAAEVV